MKLTHLQYNQIRKIINNKNYKLENIKYPYFVETGTYQGETVMEMYSLFKKIYTVEVSELIYRKTRKKLSYLNNVEFILGDSATLLDKVISEIPDNTVFWLDGHWSGGITSKGIYEVPIIKECKHIDKHYKSSHGIIIIDDFRLFGTTKYEDWGNISTTNIYECFKTLNITNNFIVDDRLIITIEK